MNQGSQQSHNKVRRGATVNMVTDELALATVFTSPA